MLQKRKRWLISLFTAILLFTIGTSVMADDHEDHDDDDAKYEYYQKSGDEEEEEDEWDQEQQAPFTAEQQNEYWNIWSREPRNNPNNPLPITEPTEVKVLAETRETKLYLIPGDGQLLVSAEALAGALDADLKVYPKSKIAQMKKGEIELIIKAGSNAAFVNGIKTPMPIKATAYENGLYFPISVGANVIGYRVSWDSQKSVLIMKAIKGR